MSRLWYTTQDTLDFTRSLPTTSEEWKHPTRGGQDLSNRYKRLEKSLRGKGAYEQDISELKEDAEGAISSGEKIQRRRRKPKTFMGFIIPEQPKPPAEDECCMSGCAICVYDLYQEALDDYNKAIDSLQKSLRALRVPESKWPAEIRTSRQKRLASKKNITLSAFEELERRLNQKHHAETQGSAG